MTDITIENDTADQFSDIYIVDVGAYNLFMLSVKVTFSAPCSVERDNMILFSCHMDPTNSLTKAQIRRYFLPERFALSVREPISTQNTVVRVSEMYPAAPRYLYIVPEIAGALFNSNVSINLQCHAI